LADEGEAALSAAKLRSPFLEKPFLQRQGNALYILEPEGGPSLRGKQLGPQEIACGLLPQLNEALLALHEAGIAHNAICPENIACDAHGGYALKGFGSMAWIAPNAKPRKAPSPKYKAPQSYEGAFGAQADYYSLGLSLYEIAFGAHPLVSMSALDIAKFSEVGQLPFPRGSDPAFCQLVSGLCLPNPPNSGYWEAAEFCKAASEGAPLGEYLFGGAAVCGLESAKRALGSSWEEGKREWESGRLLAWLKRESPALAAQCANAVPKDPDAAFITVLSAMAPGGEVYWKGGVWPGLKSFAASMLSALQAGDKAKGRQWAELAKCGALFTLGSPQDSGALQKIAQAVSGEWEGESLAFFAAYALSGERTLCFGGRRFTGLKELASFLSEALASSPDDFSRFAREIMPKGEGMHPQLRAWMELNGWQRQP
jgi:serine/threonine protein kinase